MRIGIVASLTEDTIAPGVFAAAVEARGFDSLFLPEHTHIPTTCRKAPSGADLPDEYRRLFDPFLALAVAAASTQSLLLGTGICLAAQHDPILLAKQVATLDVLSGGRVVLGVGAGWNVPEAENHGVPAQARWATLREHVLAMTAIWTNTEAEYHGDRVNFGPMWQWPKPCQRPRPPVLVAGNGPRVLDRVLQYGDGWMPLAHGEPEAALLERIAGLPKLSADQGRPPVPVTVFGCPQDVAAVSAFRDAGTERCLFWIASGNRTEMLHSLDHAAEIRASALSG